MPVYRNINVAPTGAFLADGRPILKSGIIYPQFNNILMAESVGGSNYNGLNVRLNKRFSKVMNSGDLHLVACPGRCSRAECAGQRRVLAGGSDEPAARLRQRVHRQAHAFLVSGVLNPQFGISGPLGYLAYNNRLALIFDATSGDIFNLAGNLQLNGDPSNSILAATAALRRAKYGARSRGLSLDVRYSRIFPIGERFRPEFLAESTNLFNHPNIPE